MKILTFVSVKLTYTDLEQKNRLKLHGLRNQSFSLVTLGGSYSCDKEAIS